MRRRRSTRGWGPLWLGVCVAVAGLACWEWLAARHLPDEPFREGLELQGLLWVAPGVGPLYPVGDPAAAALVVLGDSRVNNAIVPEALDAAGLGPVALVWGGGGPVVPFSEYALELAAPRVVLALSVLSLSRFEDTVAQLILRRRPPPDDTPDRERALVLWRRDRMTALEQAGYERPRYLPILDGLVTLLRSQHADSRPTPASIDRHLAEQADAWRDRHVRVLRTDVWHERWFYPLDPRGSDDDYQRSLGRTDLAGRQDELATALRLLRRVQASGREVLCLRLPIDPGLLEIEEQCFPSELFGQRCRRAGIAFVDHSREPYATRDGSHLTGPAADAYSARLTTLLADPRTWRP